MAKLEKEIGTDNEIFDSVTSLLSNSDITLTRAFIIVGKNKNVHKTTIRNRFKRILDNLGETTETIIRKYKDIHNQNNLNHSATSDKKDSTLVLPEPLRPGRLSLLWPREIDVKTPMLEEESIPTDDGIQTISFKPDNGEVIPEIIPELSAAIPLVNSTPSAKLSDLVKLLSEFVIKGQTIGFDTNVIINGMYNNTKVMLDFINQQTSNNEVERLKIELETQKTENIKINEKLETISNIIK